MDVAKSVSHLEQAGSTKQSVVVAVEASRVPAPSLRSYSCWQSAVSHRKRVTKADRTAHGRELRPFAGSVFQKDRIVSRIGTWTRRECGGWLMRARTVRADMFVARSKLMVKGRRG